MITTLNVLGTVATIAVNVSLVIGFPIYAFRARRDGYPARHRAPENGSTMVRLPVIDSAELRAARALTEQIATGIERRAMEWNYGYTPELERYEHGAGSTAYLDLTAGSLDRERRDLVDPDRRVTTGEMYALFGSAPVTPDEWLADTVAA